MDVARLFDNIAAIAGVNDTWLLDAESVVFMHRSRSSGLAGIADKTHPVRTLFAAADAAAAGNDDAVLRCERGCALFRRTGPYLLVVVTQDDSALNAVRMVSNLLLRNLTPESVARLKPAPPAPPVPPDDPQPKPSRAPRMYRGQPY